jgi:16S rRNA (guanine966-N2)-methyltransferase
VAGKAKGRRLQAPPGDVLRPTSDRVREAIFDMLTSLDVLGGATVADLFAGTGALGVEALSRGAGQVVFVEEDPVAMDSIKVNLVSTGLYAWGELQRKDVLEWVRTARPVDVAFVDPPYSFSEWGMLLDHLKAELAVLESDRELELPEGWEVLKVKRYGGTVVTLARPVDRSSRKADP